MSDLLQAAFDLPVQSLQDFLHLGGWVLQVILFAALAMWTLILERYWYLYRIHPQALAARRAEWSARSERRSWGAHRVRDLLCHPLLDLQAPCATC